MKMRLSLALSFLLLVLVSCTKPDPLIGRWQEVEGSRWMEYFADGSLVTKADATGMGGTWKRLEDGRVKVEVNVLGVTSVDIYQVAIDGDAATLTSSEGKIEKFVRIPAGKPVSPGPAGEEEAQEPDGRVEDQAQRLADEEDQRRSIESIQDDGEAQRQTVRDIRGVGTAMYSWLTDQYSGNAPGQAQTFDLGLYPALSHGEIENILCPRYIRSIPEHDGWGHPYEFYLNVGNPLAMQLMGIRSPGRDGVYTDNVYRTESFAPGDFDQDIVWADGFFVRWPTGRSMGQ